MHACEPDAAMVSYPKSFPAIRARPKNAASTTRSPRAVLTAAGNERMTSAKPFAVSSQARCNSEISYSSLINRAADVYVTKSFSCGCSAMFLSVIGSSPRIVKAAAPSFRSASRSSTLRVSIW